MIIAFAAPGVLSGQVKGPRVDTAKYVIMKYDPKDPMQGDLFREGRAAPLTGEEVDGMEELIVEACRVYNVESAEMWRLFPLSTYNRIYIAVTTATHEKEVWVYFFHKQFGGDWRHQIPLIDDGGPSVFRLIINLSRRRVGPVMTNGIA